MSPVLFTLGSIDVLSFTALMALALGAGLWLTWWQARRLSLLPSDVLDVALVGVLTGVIAARAMYVASNWGYYQMHRDQIAVLWQGGLSWHGGLAGGAIGVALASRWRKLPTRQVFDALTPGLMAGAALGWLGCYLDGVAYGREVFPGDRWWFLAADLPDIYSQWNPRFATQLLGAVWAALCLFTAIGALRDGGSKTKDGVRYSSLILCPLSFAVTMALYSAGMFVLGFTRGDVVPTLGGWRLDQVLDAAIVIAAVTYVLLKRHDNIHHV